MQYIVCYWTVNYFWNIDIWVSANYFYCFPSDYIVYVLLTQNVGMYILLILSAHEVELIRCGWWKQKMKLNAICCVILDCKVFLECRHISFCKLFLLLPKWLYCVCITNHTLNIQRCTRYPKEYFKSSSNPAQLLKWTYIGKEKSVNHE
jgi:hypothetical protein